MIYIGIDTGFNTGIAVYNSKSKTIVSCVCVKIHVAMEIVKIWHNREQDDMLVRVEDARQRTWFGFHTAKEDRARLQGAGSVKRDAVIWEDFLKDEGIPFEMVAPKHNATKMTAEAFRRLTGYKGKTNEHGRDAAMLVYGF